MKLEIIPALIERLTGVRPPDGTWRRWVLRGVMASHDQRVKLFVIRLGGKIYSTEEHALQFLKAINSKPSGNPVKAPTEEFEAVAAVNGPASPLVAVQPQQQSYACANNRTDVLLCLRVGSTHAA